MRAVQGPANDGVAYDNIDRERGLRLSPMRLEILPQFAPGQSPPVSMITSASVGKWTGPSSVPRLPSNTSQIAP